MGITRILERTIMEQEYIIILRYQLYLLQQCNLQKNLTIRYATQTETINLGYNLIFVERICSQVTISGVNKDRFWNSDNCRYVFNLSICLNHFPSYIG